MLRIYSAMLVLAIALLGATVPARAGAEPIVIYGAEVLEFDGQAVIRRPAQTVRIEAGRVVSVTGTEEGPPASDAIDGRGLYLMPGLTDMHVHVWDEAELGAYLAHGVTSIRNLSGMPFHLRLAAEIEAGRLVGPRLHTSGPILNSAGANFQVNHERVETAQEARAAVRQPSKSRGSVKIAVRIRTGSTVRPWRAGSAAPADRRHPSARPASSPAR